MIPNHIDPWSRLRLFNWSTNLPHFPYFTRLSCGASTWMRTLPRQQRMSTDKGELLVVGQGDAWGREWNCQEAANSIGDWGKHVPEHIPGEMISGVKINKTCMWTVTTSFTKPALPCDNDHPQRRWLWLENWLNGHNHWIRNKYPIFPTSHGYQSCNRRGSRN